MQIHKHLSIHFKKLNVKNFQHQTSIQFLKKFKHRFSVQIQVPLGTSYPEFPGIRLATRAVKICQKTRRVNDVGSID